MKKSKVASIVAGIALSSACVHAALVGSVGYTVTTIYSGSWLGGFGSDGSSLYVGDSGTVYSMDTLGGNVQSVGALPAGDDNSIVSANPQNGTVFAAVGSYNPPFPYQFGRFSGGSFVAEQTINGAYDAAFDSAGNMFISALHEDYTGDGTNDTAVYYYDQFSAN